MSETSSVTIEVLSLAMVRGRGGQIGLAIVEVTLDGVAIVLQGVRVLRRPDGYAVVEMPCYRHSDGDLVPAVVLPEELEDAIARQVLEQAVHAAVVTTLGI